MPPRRSAAANVSAAERDAQCETDILVSSYTLCWCKKCKGLTDRIERSIRKAHWAEHGWLQAKEKKDAAKAARRGGSAPKKEENKSPSDDDEDDNVPNNDADLTAAMAAQSVKDKAAKDKVEKDKAVKDKAKKDKAAAASEQAIPKAMMDAMQAMFVKFAADYKVETKTPPATGNGTVALLTGGPAKKDSIVITPGTSATPASSETTTSGTATDSMNHMTALLYEKISHPDRTSHSQHQQNIKEAAMTIHDSVINVHKTYRAWAQSQYAAGYWRGAGRNWFEYMPWCHALDLLLFSPGAKMTIQDEVIRMMIMRLETITQANQSGNWAHVDSYGGVGCTQTIAPAPLMAAIQKKAVDTITLMGKHNSDRSYDTNNDTTQHNDRSGRGRGSTRGGRSGRGSGYNNKWNNNNNDDGHRGGHGRGRGW